MNKVAAEDAPELALTKGIAVENPEGTELRANGSKKRKSKKNKGQHR